MNISFTYILFVLIIFQLLFLSIYLLTQGKGKGLSNILFGLFFLCISLNLLDVFLLMSGAYAGASYLAGWGSCLPLLFGPLIYFYTQSVLFKGFSLSIKTWPHFLPFITCFCVTEFYILFQSRVVEEKLLSNTFQHHLPKAVSIVSTLIFIQFLVYIIISLRKIAQYKKASGQYFSNDQQRDVSSLYSTILFFLLIVIITILNGLLSQTSLANYFLVGFNIVVFALLIFVLTVLLKALNKPATFVMSEKDLLADQPVSFSKPVISDAEQKEKQELAQTVMNYMQSNKPWLEPELTLEQLASQLSLKPRLLSQVINEMLGKNFYDFINHYRIEEAERLLTNPKDKKITILEVLYEVGFNSKSSFNSLFKKYTGLTPSEFRKKQSS
jgi:AraC-like DNA-binding protein